MLTNKFDKMYSGATVETIKEAIEDFVNSPTPTREADPAPTTPAK